MRPETAISVAVVILFSVLIVTTAVYFQNDTAHNKDQQIADLKSILNLEKKETVVNNYITQQEAGNHSTVVYRSYQYSGYIIVSGTSTTNNAYVRLEYWFDGKLYSFTQTLGTSGELFFAIPKTDSATFYAGNLNTLDGATETLTIIYHY